MYRGAGPGEVESQVVKPIEDAVAGIAGVDTIQSFSRENVGLILIQFKLSVKLDEGVAAVRDKIASMPGLPKEADLPRVSRLDISATPVVTYAVSADMDSAQLRQLIRDEVEPALAQLEGVAQVRTLGGDQREIRVDISMDSAKSAGVAPAQVAELIGMENVDVPAGRFDLGVTELSVRSSGQFATVDDIAALPISRGGQLGTQVRLDEIATITDGVADRRTVARLNGREAVVMEVVKQPGSNSVLVADKVKARMEKLIPEVGRGFAASMLLDSSILIQENAHEVWVALFFGGFMAVLIILMFLLDVRGTVISSLALPTSVIGTFFFMFVMGYTLNQMTLLALALSIGLLIDDAVVVREAITHRLEKGQSPEEAASKGTRDVFLAVLATTFSLVAVFVPVAFMPGLVGKFFKEFGLTISAAVVISMFVSFTLDPMLSSRWSKQKAAGPRRENVVAAKLRAFFDGTDALYARALGWSMHNRGKTWLMALLVIGSSLALGSKLGLDFLVPTDKSFFYVTFKLPAGSSVQESVARGDEAQRLLSKLPDVIDVYALAGADPNGFGGDANTVRMRLMLKGRDERSVELKQIKEEARAKLATLPPMEINVIDPPEIEGVGDFLPVMLYVMGQNFEVLEAEAERAADIMRNLRTPGGNPMLMDVRVVSNPPKPELSIDIDRSRAADHGLSAGALGMQLRMAMNGAVVGKLREGTQETDIVVRLAEQDRASPESLSMLEVFTPGGPRAIGDVAAISIKETPSVIERFARQRRVTITALPTEHASLGAVSSKLKKEFATAPPPPGYTIFYDGMMKVLAELEESIALVAILALAFLYMVLASQFESFKHPITVMMAIPLALVGAGLALYFTGWTVTMGAIIGLFLLAGLVTKNSILLVDQTLQNMRAGQGVDEALLNAGPRRLRPILMTSAAMAIGMVPTALGRGQGFEFRAPMAIGVIGGVITSTFLTLFVVPLLFALFEKLTPKRFREKHEAPVEAAS